MLYSKYYLPVLLKTEYYLTSVAHILWYKSTGCAFVTFSLFEHHSKVESKDCEVSTIDGESHADCSLISNSSNPLNTVPNNLDPNIQV